MKKHKTAFRSYKDNDFYKAEQYHQRIAKENHALQNYSGNVDYTKLNPFMQFVYAISTIQLCNPSALTDLNNAVIGNNEEKVKFLIAHKTALDFRDTMGRTPLYLSLERNNLNMVHLLLDNGANPNVGVAGHSPLMLCAANGFNKQAELLLKKGATLDIKDHKGRTALMLAIIDKNPVITKMLLELNADPYEKDNLGFTAFCHAEEHPSSQINEILQSYKNSELETIRIERFRALRGRPLVFSFTKNHGLINDNNLLKISDFRPSLEYKALGTTPGEVCYDKNNQKWLIKKHSNSVWVIKEYIAGNLFNLLLEKNTPETAIVIDEGRMTLALGSKYIENFKPLSSWKYPQTEFSIAGKRLEGKPLVGFMDVISAAAFLGDIDANGGNVGTIDQGDSYILGKIDHGHAFNYDGGGYFSLHYLGDEINRRYISSLESTGFDNVYQSISQIANLDFTKIKTTLATSIDIAKKYTAAIQKSTDINYGDKALDKFSNKLLSDLQKQQIRARDVANFMLFERAICKHDLKTSKELIHTSIKMDSLFTPFFKDKYNQKSNISRTDITGYELAELEWPELLCQKI